MARYHLKKLGEIHKISHYPAMKISMIIARKIYSRPIFCFSNGLAKSPLRKQAAPPSTVSQALVASALLAMSDLEIIMRLIGMQRAR